MNGRFFDGRQVSASLYDGKERFSKSNVGNDLFVGEEGDEDEKRRLEDFASWLENDGEN